jgi:hypothetical protein
MGALLVFNQSATVSTVTVSTLVDIGAYLMPPLSLEIWGGDDPKHTKIIEPHYT